MSAVTPKHTAVMAKPWLAAVALVAGPVSAKYMVPNAATPMVPPI
jgi:hypothetical protein